MNKALVSAALLLLLSMAVSCRDEAPKNPAENKMEAAAEAINTAQIRFVTVKTDSVATSISVSGRITADNRVELFPEVQGKMTAGNKPFREGVSYQKGEIIVTLDDSDTRLQVQSSRSKFKTLVSALMADIKLDHPETFPLYEAWFQTLSADKSISPVPAFEKDARRFLESKGVYELYYSIKSAEDRLKNFTIRAPFSGILSAAKAEPGQVVGPQFHMGTLVDPSLFILNASINSDDAEWVLPGQSLEVTNRDQNRVYNAVVARVNPSVDPASQQVFVYLEVSDEDLREGMYLEGEIQSDRKIVLARIPKSALLRTGDVLAKRDGSLAEIPVEIMDLERTHLWVRGLQNGDEIIEDVSEPAAGRIINQD